MHLFSLTAFSGCLESAALGKMFVHAFDRGWVSECMHHSLFVIFMS